MPAVRAASEPPPASPRRADGLALVDVRRLWPDLLESVKDKRRFTWILLSQNAQVAAVDDKTLTVALVNAGARHSFSSGGSEEILRQAAIDVIGHDWRIEAIVDPSAQPGATPRRRHPARRAARRRRDTAPAPGRRAAARRRRAGRARDAVASARGAIQATRGRGEAPRRRRAEPSPTPTSTPTTPTPTTTSAAPSCSQRELGASIIEEITARLTPEAQPPRPDPRENTRAQP